LSSDKSVKRIKLSIKNL